MRNHDKSFLLHKMHLLQYLLQHIQIHLVDDSCLLQGRDEFRRGQESFFRVIPARKRFFITHSAIQCPDQWLIVNLNPVLRQGLIQMIDNITCLQDLLLHLLPEVGICRYRGIFQLITGVFRAVAGYADINLFRPVPIDSDTNRKILSVVRFQALGEDFLQLRLHAVFLCQSGKMILRDAAQAIPLVMALQNPRNGNDEPVSFLVPVLPVEMLHAHKIKVQQRRLPVRLQQIGPVLRCRKEEGSHVWQAGQVIGVYAAVEILGICLLHVTHMPECIGQLSDLIPAPVIQFHIVIRVLQLPRSHRQTLQRPRNHARGNQQDRREKHHRHRRSKKNRADKTMPRGVNLFHWRDDSQLHPVSQREKGHLPLLSVRSIPKQFFLAAFICQHLLKSRFLHQLRHLALLQLRMVEDSSLLIEQAGKSCLINPDRTHLILQRLQRDIHSQHADDSSRAVDRHGIGADPHSVQNVRLIGADPGRAPSFQGSVIPEILFFLLQVLIAERPLFDKPRLSDSGIIESLACGIHLRIDAKIIGHASECVTGNAFEGILNLCEIRFQIGFQALRLPARPFFVRRIPSCGGTLHQCHTVQGIHCSVRDNRHGMFDVDKVFIQRIHRILSDEIHHLDGCPVGLPVKQHITGRSYGQQSRHNYDNNDCCYLKPDRMYLHRFNSSC